MTCLRLICLLFNLRQPVRGSGREDCPRRVAVKFTVTANGRIMGEGTLSGIIRFVCHLPFAFYAFGGISDFNFVKDHMGVLLAPPLGPKVFVGNVFGGPIAIIGFFWNFFLWIPTLRSKGGGLFFLGVVDAVVAGLLLIPLAIEASYIGFTPGQCAQLKSGAPPTNNLIYFQRVAGIKVDEENIAQGTCDGFFMRWYLGLVVLILYTISATANMLIGYRSQREYGVSPHNRVRISSQCLLSPVPPFTALIKGIFEFICQLTPRPVYNALFFANRYARHWFRYKGSRTKQKVRDTYALSRRRARKAGGQQNGLLSVLSPVVVEKIVSDLHHVDLVNLSLTSRAIREAVFLGQGSSAVQLRQLSCWGDKKYDCRCCGVQICDECSKSKACTDSRTSFHDSLCAAACSRCYYKEISYAYWKSLPCDCNDGRKGGPYLYDNPPVSHPVCRDCHDLPGTGMLIRKEKRDEVAYAKFMQQSLSCSICSESLPRTGPRWWVCTKCRKECRDSCHLGWSQKLEEV
ncbi:hypothetical protein F4802DRAFT_566301 [Xylaria palmicola]|nr:hypothetical protein F4802DRAFT_566301 [Xylaria palmicola]